MEVAVNQQDIVYALIKDEKDKIISSKVNIKSDLVSKNLAGNQLIPELGANELIIASQLRIELADGRKVDLIVGLDRRRYDAETQARLAQSFLIILLTALLAGWAIQRIFRRQVLKPILALQYAAEKISEFDLDHHVKITGHNELSNLGEAFNEMTEQLSEAILDRQNTLQELSALNESLEERIHKRTHELQRMNSRIMHQAMHDHLTGLPNRALIMERLKQAIRFAHRQHHKVAVFMMDLNRFKEVNDTLGHPIGDKVLIEVAHRLPPIVRETDTIGRLGGDEFVVILPETSEEDAHKVAKKILQQFTVVFDIEDHHLSIGTSVGMALYPDHGETPDELIQHADIALYVAKSKRSSHIAIYDESEDHHSVSKLLLVSELKRAIENNGLSIEYQPQVNLLLNQVCGLEALCRWHHPTQGDISPEVFIDMAEDSGLIRPLTHWMLNETLKFAAQLKQQNIDVKISLNLSMSNLIDQSFMSSISRKIKQYQLTSADLKLEITESMIMSDPDRVNEILLSPSLEGINISIDDFGTGYSSLGHLKRLPVNEIKIDKSFISDITRDQDDVSIVNAIIQMAENLNLNIVAEGVENNETAEMLHDMDCIIVQGYHYSRPIAADKVAETIKTIEDSIQIK